LSLEFRYLILLRPILNDGEIRISNFVDHV